MDRPALSLQILEELGAIRRALEANTAAIAALTAGRQADDGKLIALLAAISAEIGNASWPVHVVFDMALDQAPGASNLLHAIAAIIGKRKSGNQHNRLGMFLQQHLGVTGRWRLDLHSRGRDGNVYRVTRL